MNSVKLFDKWSLNDIEFRDISLQPYITVESSGYVPFSAGRWQTKRFKKAHIPIVERLVNSLMMHGRNTGKKLMAVRIVEEAFDIIHLLTGENPIQVLVKAIEFSGPREDSTRVGGAGTVRRQAVDVSPLRRVNVALYLMASGARTASFRKVRTISECLAEEIIKASRDDLASYAIRKKSEVERMAVSNR